VHLSNPKNGQVLLYGEGTKSFAVYACNSGYRLLGNPGRVCTSDLSWTGYAPDCISDCKNHNRSLCVFIEIIS